MALRTNFHSNGVGLAEVLALLAVLILIVGLSCPVPTQQSGVALAHPVAGLLFASPKPAMALADHLVVSRP
jgi:hypothetical protein